MATIGGNDDEIAAPVAVVVAMAETGSMVAVTAPAVDGILEASADPGSNVKAPNKTPMTEKKKILRESRNESSNLERKRCKPRKGNLVRCGCGFVLMATEGRRTLGAC
mmetsp:Transcript_6168/g.10658  ORF Transcript_6168/g.10658 Transcript_6168/m.10658 type:complete len:108 (+) Transcript_6168:1080-1403(+)|eukprot:CAMPEP_0178768240 /NCGR_PEP_ID=MMETSP0744-20121128/20127_1 /TAXON_ID=913974 /ORGANISM="Nitzschia punctata, Strain CCMP561" /LENGTH=107 /DNA_ID=CAMNT_0020424285 /DNA_START=1127 /DNA_END=1450 /DNA_ORIENTATION=+